MSLPTNVIAALTARGWISDLSDGDHNPTRIAMYVRFCDENERNEREHHGARLEELAKIDALRSLLP